MKKTTLFLALALAAAPALAAPDAKPDPAKSAQKSSTISVSAVVDAIDYKTREVTLDTMKGKVTVVVSEDVKNLDKVKKGDTVTVAYHEGLLAEARPATEAEKAQPLQETVKGSAGGDKPKGGIGYQVKAVTTLVAMDKAKQEMTFKGPRGKVETIHVEDPKNFDKVKVGDTVVFTYTEAVAVSVTPGAAPAKK